MYRITFSIIFITSFFYTTEVIAQKREISKAEKTFESFWKFFDENYAFFKHKSIDWDEVYKQFRPRVTANTSDDSLFNILCAMTRPLNDGHVEIKTSDGKYFDAGRPSRIMEELFSGELDSVPLAGMVENTLISNGFQPVEKLGPKINGRPLFTYSSSNKYGYLRFTRCTATQFYTTGSLFSLDKILKEFNDKEAIIIDIRFNSGGTDNFSRKVAGRFTDEPYLGYYKQEKNGKGHDDFDELKPYFIKPRGRAKFLKPIILLTNDVTVSAADVFTLIMKENPQVTIIGENSNGSFSDRYPYIFPKKLPNGWKVHLSNQRYFSTDMINYEGTGVPVDIEVLNMQEDIKTMNDSVLLEALKVLNEKQNLSVKN